VHFKSTRCLLWFRGSGIGFQLREDKIDRKGLNQPAICCSSVVVVVAATEVAGWQDSNSSEGVTTGRQQSTGCLFLCRDSNMKKATFKRLSNLTEKVGNQLAVGCGAEASASAAVTAQQENNINEVIMTKRNH